LVAVKEQTFDERATSKEREMVSERVVVNATMEGLLPSLTDHKISRYIAKIGRLAGESLSDGSLESMAATAPELKSLDTARLRSKRSKKIDPQLEVMSEAQLAPGGTLGFDMADVVTESARAVTSSRRGSLGSPVLLRLKTPDWVAPPGMTIHSRIGNFATAHCTAGQLEQLRNDPAVLGVEASRDAGIPELARSVPFIYGFGENDVFKPPTDETGSHAIAGLIDTGIDIMHEAFLDGAGQTRILGIWNQRETAPAGSAYQSPKATFPGVFTQDYGVLYLTNHINALIAGGAGSVPSILRDPGSGLINSPGHGTHVASIAAGRAVGAFQGGVAPDAKILVVIPNMVTKPTDPPSLGYSNSHVDALSFLLTAAKAPAIGGGLPIAVNVSLGMNAGAHDGLSLLEASFDAATRNGLDEGVMIVKSAGNEGDSGGHAELQAFNGKQFITWQSDLVARDRDYIEVWYDAQHELEFVLIDPAGNRSPVVSSANPSASVVLGGNRCTLLLTEYHPDCGDDRLQITISPEPAPIRAGLWQLDVTGVAVGGGSQQIHAWVERDIARAVRFQTGDNNAMTLSVPGTARHVISVSASGSRLPLELTPSSSQGLTRDGRAKPDLCAPGTAIIAAASNSGNRQAVVAMTGTSMAAPHVTGAVVLAFSMRARLGKQPLTANRTAGILRTCTIGGNGVHNRSFGFGCLDAKKFLEVVQALP
jgi:endonuclease G